MSDREDKFHSIWSLLGYVLHQASDAFLGVVENIRTFFEGDVKTRRQVAFSVALIALSAKMAKADGIVNDNEIKAFYEIVKVDEKDLPHVARLFSLAKGDIAGFDYYAKRIVKLCKDSACEHCLLEDVLDGLFHIAKADGAIHDNEMAFLSNVSDIFGVSKSRFEMITAYHVKGNKLDPWTILGITRKMPFGQARKRYYEIVKELHPDKLAARGMPIEFIAIRNEKLAKVNNAWAMIKKELQIV